MPSKKGKPKGEFKIFLNAIGYKEPNQWVALALEMDIRGYGKTFEEALEDLVDLIKMQIGFAKFKNQPEMIWKPADPVWFERFAEARNQKLREITQDSVQSDYQVGGIPLPHVIKSLQENFREVNG